MLVTRPWSCPACGSRVTLSENASDPRQCTACHWTAPDNPNPIPPPADAPAAPPEPFPEADIAAVRIWLRRHPVAALYVLFLVIITIGLWFGGRGAREHVALRDQMIDQAQQVVSEHLRWSDMKFTSPTFHYQDDPEIVGLDCDVTGSEFGLSQKRLVVANFRVRQGRVIIDSVFLDDKFLYGYEFSRWWHEVQKKERAKAGLR